MVAQHYLRSHSVAMEPVDLDRHHAWVALLDIVDLVEQVDSSAWALATRHPYTVLPELVAACSLALASLVVVQQPVALPLVPPVASV